MEPSRGASAEPLAAARPTSFRPDYEPTPGNITGFEYLNNTHLKLAEENDFLMTRSHALEWYVTRAWPGATCTGCSARMHGMVCLCACRGRRGTDRASLA